MKFSKLLLVTGLIGGAFAAAQPHTTQSHHHQAPVVAHVAQSKEQIVAGWEQDLYPYQTTDLKQALAKISDTEFNKFAELVQPVLTIITAPDQNQRNMDAGYNAGIIIAFANTNPIHLEALAAVVKDFCEDMDSDDKPDVVEQLSAIVSTNNSAPVVQVAKVLTAGMTGYQKKQLLKNLANKPAECWTAAERLIAKLSSLFITAQDTLNLRLRLTSIVEVQNIPDFEMVTAIQFENLEKIAINLNHEANRMLEFVADYITMGLTPEETKFLEISRQAVQTPFPTDAEAQSALKAKKIDNHILKKIKEILKQDMHTPLTNLFQMASKISAIQFISYKREKIVADTLTPQHSFGR